MNNDSTKQQMAQEVPEIQQGTYLLFLNLLTYVAHFALKHKKKDVLLQLQAVINLFHASLTEDERKEYHSLITQLFKAQQMEISTEEDGVVTDEDIEGILEEIYQAQYGEEPQTSSDNE